MRYGIKATGDNTEDSTTREADVTFDTRNSIPLLEVTTPHKYETIEYTFKTTPANNTTVTIIEREHGYNFVPLMTAMYASDFTSNADLGAGTGDLKRFMNFEFYEFKTSLIPPLYIDFVDSETNMWAYCNAKKFYIKVLRTNESYLNSMAGSKWIFAFRIYAIPFSDT